MTDQNAHNVEDRNVFAIYVSYYVKVKLLVGMMGGEVSLKLPFTLMHTCSDMEHAECLTKVVPDVKPDVELHVKPDVELHVKPDVELHVEPDVELSVMPDAELHVKPAAEPDETLGQCEKSVKPEKDGT
ncbi:unnamed protein product [Phaedon cochleariae]|uniref:Uncharacterized protein n=1 Tax=Phaedon cochleariae TaxID=80249 RepID=A0A9P0GTP7_PHACE|nr:unnamed protein product [Phaedon cochleariae]